MSANERLRRGFWLLVFFAGASRSATVATDAAPPLDASAPSSRSASASASTWPEAQQVGELLRLETRAALARQRQAQQAQNRPITTESRDTAPLVQERIDVTAIYGVGRQLHVELQVNGRRLRLRSGKRLVDHDGSGFDYTLHAIQDRCVTLKSNSHPGQRRVCLDMEQ